MTIHWAAVTMMAITVSSAPAAIEPQGPPAPPGYLQPPPVPPPPACIPQNPADYTPGTDVKGRPVLPADVVPQANILGGVEVYTRVQSPVPNAPGVGVAVRLPNPTAPRCPAPPLKSGVRINH